MGSLFRDVNVGGVVTLGVWSVTGDQGLNWKQGWLNLAPYFGQADVRFRFRAVTGSGEHTTGLDAITPMTLRLRTIWVMFNN